MEGLEQPTQGEEEQVRNDDARHEVDRGISIRQNSCDGMPVA